MISGFENYDKEVRNLVEKIMEGRVSAYDRVNTSCSGLIMIGEKLKDDKLLAYGNYYIYLPIRTPFSLILRIYIFAAISKATKVMTIEIVLLCWKFFFIFNLMDGLYEP